MPQLFSVLCIYWGIGEKLQYSSQDCNKEINGRGELKVLASTKPVPESLTI